jgi:VWA domain-containing protein
VRFLTPYAALVVLLVAAPLVAFLIGERRTDRVSAVLGLGRPTRSARIAVATAVTLVAALLAFAATQPTLVRHTEQQVRTDAEAWFVLDTSLSMKASLGPRTPSRFQRAQALAGRLREELGEIPVGLASITDRSMPHVFPTPDLDTFRVAVRKTIGIERPPPTDGFSVLITTLGSLARVASDNFFAPQTRHRLMVVFTDGETKPFSDRSLTTLFRQPPGVKTILVRLWSPEERVYVKGLEDQLYRPEPAGAAYMRELAEVTDGVALAESDFDSVVESAREYLGEGPTRVLAREQRRLALAPWFAGVAFVPLGFLLWRRNL